ncbi:MAG: hypothetical protein ACRC7W_05795 [Fusobacteriaceae bacterium]
MKKSVLLVLSLFFSLSMLSYSKNEFGIVYDEDFIKVGVTKENLEKARELMGKTTSQFKILSLEKQKLEIEANQLIADGLEKNLQKLDVIFEKMGDIETNFYKLKIRSQIGVYKYISKEQYLKARENAVDRMKEEKLKSEELEKK